MKILVFAYACEPGLGSEAGAGWTWARMLARMGDTCVITRQSNRAAIEQSLPHIPERDKLQFVYIDLPQWARTWKRGQRGVRLYYMLWQGAAFARARTLNRETPFDLYWHITFANGWLGSGGSLIGQPFVYGPIGGGVGIPWRFLPSFGFRGASSEVARGIGRNLGRYLNPLAYISARRAALILVNNRETLEWLPAASRARCVVFQHTVIDEEFIHAATAASRWPDERRRPAPVALFAARLIPGKGAHLAIKALARTENWTLTLCGTGCDDRRLRRLASSLGVAERVRFIGEQSRQRIAELLMESDAFIQPSVIDDGSFAVAEARTLGTPVLCVDWGGPPAVAGPDAFVASARSPEAAIRDLEAGLNRIAANPQERKSDSSLTLDGTYERLTALLLQRGITTGAGRTAR